MKPLHLALLSSLILASSSLCIALPVDGNIFYTGTNTVQVAWNATPGKTYRLQTSTNISGPWQDALPSPGTITATNGQVFQSLSLSTGVRFYRITQLDTDGPEIHQVSPLDGAIAVGQRDVLEAWLRDETGINTNTITLAIGTNGPITLGDSRLTFTNGILTYIPGTNEVHGALGSNVTVRVSATDTLGNQTTNFTWSFQVALPTVPSTNILFIRTNGGFVLFSTNGDYLTYKYTGAFPGLTNGQQLVDTNLYTGYTRTVLSFTNYSASNTVVVLTRPTKLAELMQLGSLASVNFTDLSGESNGVNFRLTEKKGSALAKRFGVDHTADLQGTLYQDANLLVELLPGSSLHFIANLDVDANFNGRRLRQFATTLSGSADFRLDAHVQASGALDRNAVKALIAPVRKFYGTVIGVVPVWVELVFEINAGYDLHLEASADYTSGLRATKEILTGRRWSEAGGWTTISQNPSSEFSFLDPTWQIETSGNLRLYLQPKLTLYIYSAAGAWGDTQPYVDLEAHAQLDPHQWDLSLYAGLTSTIGLDLRVWDDSWGDLPDETFHLIPRTLLWETHSSPGTPQITAQPHDEWVSAGGTAIFTVQASGSPLNYRWQKNGLFLSDGGRITGTRSSTLHIANAQASDVGNYRVFLSNPSGSTISENAMLNVHSSATPAGMAFIPAGSFQMGDTFNEGDPSELPIHTVYVSAFYMDKYEVTQVVWDDVYHWATNHAYQFDYRGAAKSLHHPVHTNNWCDAVKWCNARSEKEGRVPAYYINAGQTAVYRSGQLSVQNNWVKWNAGYRLPTEAEWEKAARGGVSGHRFPWEAANTITHSRANYLSEAYNYDVSPTRGYHPTFFDGFLPFDATSPVGYFAPNGYGLYDTAGNVWELCWDRYSIDYYSISPSSDPRGPESGTGRVTRGGSFANSATFCRMASRTGLASEFFFSSFGGIRAVLPQRQ